MSAANAGQNGTTMTNQTTTYRVHYRHADSETGLPIAGGQEYTYDVDHGTRFSPDAYSELVTDWEGAALHTMDAVFPYDMTWHVLVTRVTDSKTGHTVASLRDVLTWVADTVYADYVPNRATLRGLLTLPLVGDQ